MRSILTILFTFSLVAFSLNLFADDKKITAWCGYQQEGPELKNPCNRKPNWEAKSDSLKVSAEQCAESSPDLQIVLNRAAEKCHNLASSDKRKFGTSKAYCELYYATTLSLEWVQPSDNQLYKKAIEFDRCS